MSEESVTHSPAWQDGHWLNRQFLMSIRSQMAQLGIQGLEVLDDGVLRIYRDSENDLWEYKPQGDFGADRVLWARDTEEWEKGLVRSRKGSGDLCEWIDLEWD